MRTPMLTMMAALTAGAAMAQTPPSPTPAPGPAPAASASPAAPARRPAEVDPARARAAAEATAAYNAMPDTPGTGPYAAVKELDPSIPAHVVYRPANLAALGAKKLGVVVWGNGGCRADGAGQRLHLEEIASHGYLVVAPGTIQSGPGLPPRPDATPGMGAETNAGQVKAGLDWALAENGRRESRYYGRIDPAQVAVSGYSCGGLQALQVAADPRIRAVVIHNSGMFPAGRNPIAGIASSKDQLKTLHTPVIYILGGSTDQAFPNGSDDFARIDHVPAVLVSADIGHGGTFRQPNGGRAAQIAVAWLAWQLRHDAAAGKMFVGADCGLCADATWKIQRKGL